MYDWLVAHIGAGGTLGLVFGGLLLLFFFGLGGILWQMRHLKKGYGVPALPYDKVQAAVAVAHDINQQQLKAPEAKATELEQPEGTRRLTLCDSVMIDDDRRLVLVRRDDVEHLIMVGSAGDMVIEHNIPVEPPPLDAVSMLAISRAEETPFMMLDGDQKEGQETSDTIANTPLFTLDALPSEASPEAPPLSEEDVLSEPPSDNINLTHENDLATSLMQAGKPDEPVSHLEASGEQAPMPSPDLNMASIFPERGAMSLPSSLTVNSHLGIHQTVAAQAVTQDVPQDKIQHGQEGISAHAQEELPIASYFAGGPKKAVEPQPTQISHPIEEPIQAGGEMRSQENEGHASQPLTSPAPPFADLVQAAQPTLSLNPFMRATPSPVVEDPAPKSPIEAPGEQKKAVTTTQAAPTPASPATPSPASPSSPSFINSFLGFPLENLTKTGTVSPVSQTPSQPTSQPTATDLKKN